MLTKIYSFNKISQLLAKNFSIFPKTGNNFTIFPKARKLPTFDGIGGIEGVFSPV